MPKSYAITSLRSKLLYIPKGPYHALLARALIWIAPQSGSRSQVSDNCDRTLLMTKLTHFPPSQSPPKGNTYGRVEEAHLSLKKSYARSTLSSRPVY